MGKIVHLDQNMVNMIAAGEVIERPGSVVKELMENSIDAGATQVSVAVEDGGRKLISVTDNGNGMDAVDLDAAFEPHATSKIREVDDLQSISTLGFRGEALASIAVVAQVRAVSRTKESDQVHCIEIDCGVKKPVSPCSGDFGTTIQVRDLFYKTPARRKFLRTANTELGYVSEQFTRIALARTDVALTLSHNNRELHRLAERQTTRQRIAQLFPMLAAEAGDDLVEAQTGERGIRICALLGRPSVSRTSGQFQYTFLNGRFIRDKFVSHAVKEAYRGLLEPNRFPIVFLFIEMSPSEYDINVHPTKIEVRFGNANLVHSQVLGTLRETLLGMDLHVPARIRGGEPATTDDTADRQLKRQGIADAMAEFFRKHRPTDVQQRLDFRVDMPAGNPPRRPRPVDPPVSPAAAAVPMQPAGEPKYLQIHDSYIVEQTEDGFVIIDQHALHERMLYETLCRRVRQEHLESQRLLLPETIQITDGQAAAIEANAELIARLGLELVPFGPRTYAVQAFPTLIGRVPPAEFIQDLVDLLVEKGNALSAEDLLNEVLSMTACKAAIKAGQKLSDAEIRQLLADRERYESTSRCPHGRPTTIKFSIGELEKQFKRT
ncbi:MAG: DNA mismatch repair endonuclease MutL [Sedimentisphaerales bacterium]|nr:DNA mismatch repair endonuclease MutL [Sedimentisphaerales bacterium]